MIGQVFLPKSLALIIAVILLANSARSDVLSYEAREVARLERLGFQVVSDGRGTSNPTALSYSGNPREIIACRYGSGARIAGSQSLSRRLPNGLIVSQRGQGDAYVVVSNWGRLSGVYLNSVIRDVRSGSGRLISREYERIEFDPLGSASFDDGLTCRARR